MMITRRTLLRRGSLIALPALSSAVAAAAPKKNRKSEPQAVIAGTVFQRGGLSLRGAEVVAFNKARPKKKWRAVTDMRGEFAIRIPAGEAHYQVEASAKGFEPEQRKVEIYGMERINVNLILTPK